MRRSQEIVSYLFLDQLLFLRKPTDQQGGPYHVSSLLRRLELPISLRNAVLFLPHCPVNKEHYLTNFTPWYTVLASDVEIFF